MPETRNPIPTAWPLRAVKDCDCLLCKIYHYLDHTRGELYTVARCKFHHSEVEIAFRKELEAELKMDEAL